MKLFEATIRTPDGREFKDRVGADTAQAARFLLQQRYGPRAVPYLPKNDSQLTIDFSYYSHRNIFGKNHKFCLTSRLYTCTINTQYKH